MTEPRLAKPTEHGRYYTDPAGGPDLISVTNVLDTSVHKHALRPWAVRLTVEWVLEHRIEVARRAITDRAALVHELKAVSQAVSEAAADLGTRVHLACEQRLLRAPIPNDAQVRPYLRRFDMWLAEWGVDIDRDVVATEITVLHRRLGYAGTADLMIWLPTGPGARMELWLIDYKSSATRSARSVYAENSQQLAALRFAEAVLLPDDTDGGMPAIERTAVLNLRQRSHALVEMPGNQDAFRAFRGALVNAQWHHAAPSSYPALTPPVSASTLRKAA
ncbi:hypothetical protein [Kitasatospora kifunensis]|uniref:PD-(D/E)XK endonuclease-like domain-containing protein n=1 Tax=Kitasatospora kifunensis TaxID=58351 RepID=A0A7W7QYI4_KITKI|nr:hypothetical protein [Kitasatospora kifunensis]MBB4922143.1 hypothetical protein [Kitasatospora kifunensis]